MKNFSDLNIQVKNTKFIGDKIKIREILNLPIEVYGFKIKESRFQKHKSDKCMQLQLGINGGKRVVFTGSKMLMEQIKMVPEEEFPFRSKIIQEGEMFMFV